MAIAHNRVVESVVVALDRRFAAVFSEQFFPCVALLLLFVLYPPKYTGTRFWIIAAALYALAKVFEFSDYAIFSAGYLLSGHTLKHLAAAAACFAILRCFQTRRLLT